MKPPIPIFIRRFCVVGFRLAILNLDDLSIEYIGGVSSGTTKL